MLSTVKLCVIRFMHFIDYLGMGYNNNIESVSQPGFVVIYRQ